MTLQHTLAVIGGGAAGLTVAQAAATLDIDVALIEGNLMGGDCTWYGCIPSKALLTAANAVHTARHSAAMGIHSEGVRVDFAQVMRFVRETIHDIYSEETPEVLRRDHRIAVYEVYAQFKDPHTLELSRGETVRARKIVIATGATQIIPADFEDVPYLTNHTLFDLTKRPDHLIIVGGGATGTEMVQAFCRLGTPVTLVTDRERILSDDGPEASAIIQQVLREEGVTLICVKQAKNAYGTAGDITVTLHDGTSVHGSHVLLANGKSVDVRNLNPDAAGLAHLDGKLVVDQHLRTSQRHILAAGDVVGGPMFTHAGVSDAVVALTNLISPIPTKRNTRMPWATFTDPEVAQAGLTEAHVRERGKTYRVTRMPITRADRAMTDGKTCGFIKLVHAPAGKLYGATIVGPNAAEMMNEWAQIIARGGQVNEAASAIHIYPTLGITNALIATEHLRHYGNTSWVGTSAKRVVKWLT